MAQNIGALHAQLSAGAASFERDMQRAKRAVDRTSKPMQRSFKGMERAANQNIASITRLSTVTGTLTRLVPGLAAAFSVVGITNFVSDTVTATAELGNLADRLNISSDRLEGLRHAADVSGTSAATLDKAIEKLQLNLGQAANNTGPAVKAFERLGIEVRDAGGEVKTTDAIFDEIVTSMERVGSAAERAGLLGQIFGQRYGAELVTLISRGVIGIKELEDEITKLEIGSVRAAQKLDDEWTTFVTNFSNQMKQAALDALNFFGVIDTAFEALDLPGKIEQTKETIADLQAQLAAPTDIATTALLDTPGEDLTGELKRQQEVLAGLEKQAALQERLKGITEGLRETDVVSQKQVDQVQSFIETQTRNIENLELTAEAMQRGETAVQGLSDAIAIQSELIRLGLIPADTSLVEAMTLANTSTDERVLKVAALVEQYRLAQQAIDEMTLAEQRATEAAAERNREIEKQAELIGELEKTEEEAGKALINVDRLAVQAGSTVASSLASAAVSGESLNDTFQNLISSLAEMVLRALLFQAIMSAFGAAGFGPAAGFSQGGVVENAKGNVVPFARGGLITEPTVFPFKDGIGLAGEKGTEAIMPLMRDSRGRLGVSAAGDGGDKVEVVNQVIIENHAQDVDVTQEQRTGANGQQQIVVTIDNALAQRVGRGEGALFKTFQRTFGAGVSPVRK